MGSPDFAVPCLEALCAHPELFNVVGVVSQPDRPAGRGRVLTPPPVKVFAVAHKLSVLQPIKMKAEATHQSLRELNPDVLVVAAYGRILPPAMLTLAPHGAINVHASLLPRHRGASPINHMLLAGDADVGVTIMRMEEGLDTGPIYATRALPTPKGATAQSLTTLLANVGAELLVTTLPKIVAGHITPQPQDHAQATFAPLLTKELGKLDFTKSATALERQVRAFFPWPSSYAFKGTQRVSITQVAVVPQVSGAPGEIVSADAQGIVVACGDGGLRLLQVQPEGKKAMPATAWLQGRGIAVGDKLG